MKRPHKHLRLWSSLKYGWRLTVKHFNTLLPGSMLFYGPEVAQRFGWQAGPWSLAVTAWHSLWACLLLWHAMQLSDRETRHSRLHEATLPAPGYLGRFLASTALFWGVLALGMLPAVRVATGAWWPTDRSGALAWLWRPWAWDTAMSRQAAGAALAALPVGLWSVYGWFHGYYVADEGQNAWPSMRSSFHAVRGAFWKTLLFLGVIGGINAAGYALDVVGIFVAFPVTLMATTYVHLELKDQSPAAAKPKKEPTRRRR